MYAIQQAIAKALADSLGKEMTVFLLSLIPITEARVAIPFGRTIGLTPLESFFWAFLGSSLLAPVLILVFIPLLNALARTKLFGKVGKFLYDKFEKKSQALKKTTDGATDEQSADKAPTKRKILTKDDVKKMGGVALFVAVPLPLTGVWTGSAVASIIKIGFVRAAIGVVIGNAAACGIITLISFLFEKYVSLITLVFLAIAVAVVVMLVIKLILYKPEKPENADTLKGDDE